MATRASDSLIARLAARSRQSRWHRDEYGVHLADSRAVAGYRPSLKDVVYPIVAERADGCRLWDIDGNEYIDLAMGFGVQLFGHRAPFIEEAIAAQLARGMHLGPQAALAGPTAKLLCELIGHERVCFCNSGTEAVMTALRLARAHTGRDGLAMFKWSYHGHFDGTLGKPRVADPTTSRPLAPGIAQSAVSDLLMLDYGEDEAFDILDRQAGKLAAVIVEPVQSLRPHVQPVAFLRRLREWTKANGVVLIFDEILLGFRVHPAGAHAQFGIDADLATYGKILGGGLAIGCVAGRAEIMSAIDGGCWRVGDNAGPAAHRTFFAGTFNKNPLGMAVAHAVLERLTKEGPHLQATLNERTRAWAEALNDTFTREEIPLQIAAFGSLFRFASVKNLETFFFGLVANGVYVWEGRSCFLSTAHSDADLAALAAAVKETARWWNAEKAWATNSPGASG
jgi:glutamate-1-semialdehyde aminotransferase